MDTSRKTMDGRNDLPKADAAHSAGGSRDSGKVAMSLDQIEEKCARVRCTDMFTEWRLCISAYHQFHQYYIYGEFSHCKVEKARMYNCFKSKFRNEKAKKALVESLESDQESMHTADPPWEMRDTPPSDWNDNP